jgi:hypothetical protein
MPKPRIPSGKARILGADIRSPGRYAGRNDPAVASIGEPSPHLKDEERASWLRFTAELPWLVESDRALLEVASVLRSKLDCRDTVGLNHLQIYSAILSKLGATPADRSRVSMPDDRREPDEFFPD